MPKTITPRGNKKGSMLKRGMENEMKRLYKSAKHPKLDMPNRAVAGSAAMALGSLHNKLYNPNRKKK